MVMLKRGKKKKKEKEFISYLYIIKYSIFTDEIACSLRLGSK